MLPELELDSERDIARSNERAPVYPYHVGCIVLDLT